jgi:transcriptional regulator with XRE-family HTH domain
MPQENFDLQKIGKTLKRLREGEGLNQSQFAKKVGLTQSAISQFEEGKRIPSTKALQKIAVSLGLSIDTLVGNIVSENETDNEKAAALQSLVSNIKNRDMDKDAIIALNRFIDAGFYPKDEKKE